MMSVTKTAQPIHPGEHLSDIVEELGDLEGDVRQSIARIQASPFIPNKGDVRGFVYDCATGKLNEVRP